MQLHAITLNACWNGKGQGGSRAATLPPALPEVLFWLQVIPKSFYLKTCFVADVSLFLFKFCFGLVLFFFQSCSIYSGYSTSSWLLNTHTTYLSIHSMTFQNTKYSLKLSVCFSPDLEPIGFTYQSSLVKQNYQSICQPAEIVCWTSL